jgi:hypothetical protein
MKDFAIKFSYQGFFLWMKGSFKLEIAIEDNVEVREVLKHLVYHLHKYPEIIPASLLEFIPDGLTVGNFSSWPLDASHGPLFNCRGTIKTEDNEEVDYCFNIESKFKEFSDNEIIFSFERSASDSINEIFPALSMLNAARLLPGDLNSIKLGFSIYENQTGIGLQLGKTPASKFHFHTEISKNKIYLCLESLNLSKKGVIPLVETNILKIIHFALNESAICSDFIQRIEKNTNLKING